MTDPESGQESGMAKNIRLYPWFKFFQNLVFWQAIWFLYFQNELSAAEAILLYAVYDVATTVLEVPSGYMSDRLGRRITLIAAAVTGFTGAVLLAFGSSFAIFALGQIFLGAASAFASGTDSALLYESLATSGRKQEIEQQELRAWRFAFCALAISAVLGGLLALQSVALPFLTGAAALAGALLVALLFSEPPRTGAVLSEGAELVRLKSLGSALTEPVLIWLFILSVLMYGFSHVPFVFGQPFILEALEDTGLSGEAPLVSGVVSAIMMLLSVITSLFALRLRNRIGLPAILLLAFSIQIALSGVLALTDNAIAIAFLFLRMVPNSLSQPFILARIQPELGDESRATYLSLKSLFGRLIFAGTLLFAAGSASDKSQMAYVEIQQILSWYSVGGILCLAALALVATRMQIDTPTKQADA